MSPWVAAATASSPRPNSSTFYEQDQKCFFSRISSIQVSSIHRELSFQQKRPYLTRGAIWPDWRAMENIDIACWNLGNRTLPLKFAFENLWYGIRVTVSPPLGLQRWFLFLHLHRQEKQLSPGMIYKTFCTLVIIAGLSHLIKEALLGQKRLKCQAGQGSGDVNREYSWPTSSNSFTTGRHLVIFFKDKMVIIFSEIKAAVRYF